MEITQNGNIVIVWGKYTGLQFSLSDILSNIPDIEVEKYSTDPSECFPEIDLVSAQDQWDHANDSEKIDLIRENFNNLIFKTIQQ